MGDAQDEVRTQYGSDPQLKATVLPSARPNVASGLSYGFSPDSKQVKQHIISFDESGQIKIAEVTAAQISGSSAVENPTDDRTAASPEEIREMSERAANIYKNMGAAERAGPHDVPAPPENAAGAVPDRFTVPTPQKAADQMQEIPDVQIDVSQQEVNPPVPPELANAVASIQQMDNEVAAAPEEKVEKMQAAKPKPLVVSIAGPFGKMRIPYSSIFRDGICLVLVTDHRQMPGMFELPEIDTEPLTLELTINQKSVRCIWGGIQFTLPNGSVTFTVLLVQEETDVGEEGLFR